MTDTGKNGGEDAAMCIICQGGELVPEDGCPCGREPDDETDGDSGLDAIAESLGSVGVSDGRLDPETRDETGERFGYDG